MTNLPDDIETMAVSILQSYEQEMEGYSYFGSNRGVSKDDYADIAKEIAQAMLAREERLVEALRKIGNKTMDINDLTELQLYRRLNEIRGLVREALEGGGE